MIATGGCWDRADRPALFLASDLRERDIMAVTAGVWDRSDRNVMFLAGDLSKQQLDPVLTHGYLLIAVNTITDGKLEQMEKFIADGGRLFIDSGIFWLTNEHKRKHGITMDEALALAPEEIDGFEELWDLYLKTVRRLGDRCWGYIELDQGGRENKVKTRARLQALGLRPIPVWHPLNDGAEYFDELAQGYDRICMGNVVQADQQTRVRLIHHLLERRRDKYPDLWVHLLGLAPHPLLHAFADVVDSADASTWLDPVRWGGLKDMAMMRSWSALPPEYRYVLGAGDERDPATDDIKALTMSVLSYGFAQRGWRDWSRRVEELLP